MRSDWREKKKRAFNPPDRTGNPSKCSICGSVMHWHQDCPHKEMEVEQEDIPSLFANDIQAQYKDCFTGEALHCAILDSGCKTTVCGRLWYECYSDSLSDDLRKSIKEDKSSTRYRFGDGISVPSMKKVMIPAAIDGIPIKIETEVVECEIPLLLSKDAMKKADRKLNFETDSVEMFGRKFKLNFTSSGHYMINVHPFHSKYIQENQVLLNVAEMDVKEKCKIAEKLHRQFGHASSIRIIDLIKDAGTKDEVLFQCVKDAEEKCETCKRFKKPGLKPVVGFALAKEFNEVVSMDLKDISQYKVYHMVDNATRYSAACVISGKSKEIITDKFFKHWVALFGCPKKVLSDNGGEFNNNLFREMCEQLNIEVLSTAAESPWSNGITERHNALIGQMTIKVMDDSQCSIEVALAWSLAAKNALKNVYGFSPNQLVFGRNPNMPAVLENKLPALSGVTASELVADHLNALHAARISFIECEASEKLRRAIQSKVRTSTSKHYENGAKVYYKKENSDRWRGPGRVLGIDNKLVMVKHGGELYRVAPCNLQLVCDENTTVTDINTIDSTNNIDSTDNTNNTDHTEVEATNHDETSDRDVISTIDGNRQICSTNEEDDQSRLSTTESDLSTEVRLEVSEGQESEEMNPTVEERKMPEKGSKITYRLPESQDWKVATVIGRAGTARGKNKWWSNIQSEDNSLSSLNMESVETWKYVDEQVLLFSEVNSNDVMEAKLNELENLKKHCVYTEVDDKGQSTVDVRWIITEKWKDGVKGTKARLVAKGFQEKNNADLRKDSPTCLKVNIRLIAWLAVVNGWKVKVLDIRSAFLQGVQIEREVFLRPPNEAGSTKVVWRLKKTLYGLGDASRKWYLKVKETLECAGAKMSIYDEAVFYYHQNGELHGLMAIHVDDFFHCGSSRFKSSVIDGLKSKFEISKEENDFDYVGLEIKQKSDSVIFHQEKYIQGLTPLKIEDRSCKNASLSQSKFVELRSLIGQLAWVSNQTRPDIAFDVCQLSVNLNSATVNDALRANKCVKKLKNDNVAIKFPHLGELKKAKLVAYADASFANLPGGGSQGGHIIFIQGSNGNYAPLAWQSRKLKHVVKSTLGAETMALLAGVESCFLFNTMFKELLGFKHGLPIIAKTDSKSLRDCAYSSKTLEDNRLKVDICVLRDYLRLNELKQIDWVETSNQLADSLTKSGASTSKLLDILSGDGTIV